MKKKLLSKSKDKAPLCKCGCKNPVKWHRQKKSWNNYLVGHGSRGRHRSEKIKKKMSDSRVGITFSARHEYARNEYEEKQIKRNVKEYQRRAAKGLPLF